MDSSALLIFIVGVLIVGILLAVVIMLTKKSASPLDVDKYRLRWLMIEQQLKREDPSSAQLCVLNADKLLDQALRERRVKGETMGERMKTAKDSWSDANGV